jgi:hypothetical protein
MSWRRSRRTCLLNFLHMLENGQAPKASHVFFCFLHA